MNIVIFVIILLVLVLVHEFGHFFTAKKFGIRVDEFGFGFPPKIFGVKYGETEYTLNLLPIGGFVKILGENPELEQVQSGVDPDADRKFYNKPKWQQAIVLVAGVVMNFLLAWLLFSIGFMSGLPTGVGSEPSGTTLKNVHTVIVAVAPKSPAEIAGLKSGDQITEISLPYSSNSADSIKNPSPEQIQDLISHRGNTTSNFVGIKYNRGDTENYAIVSPEVTDGKARVGISMDQIGMAKLGFWSSISEGARLTWYVTKGTALGLYGLLKDALLGKGSLESVTGPVGMVGIVGDAYKFGFVYLMSFAALISINLGIINLLPFPALDGGRLFFLLIEKIKGSRMNPKIVNIVNMVGFAMLILLMVVVTYHDVVKLF